MVADLKYVRRIPVAAAAIHVVEAVPKLLKKRAQIELSFLIVRPAWRLIKMYKLFMVSA